MAKEKSSSPVILRTSALQGAANGFIQAAMLTGLSPSGNDALVVKQITIEYPTFVPAGVAPFETEAELTRATKAAMSNIFDDDVIFKDKFACNAGAAGILTQKGVVTFVPDFEIVIIEDTIYFQFKSLNCTLAGTAFVSLVCQPATVTESEKVGILLTRIN